MRRALAVACVSTGLLAGCMVGPDYVRPNVDVPAKFRFEDTQARDLANTVWWSQLQDPVLDDLIRAALATNIDVRIAAARVEQFYGVLGSTRSTLFPQVGAEVFGGRTRASERTVTGAPPRNPYNSVQVDAFASWELDLFGRLRRQTEAARADLLASEAGRRSTVLSLTAAVATAYVSLRALDKELEISQRTLLSRTDSLALFVKRYKGGVISELELNQARSEYAVALAAVPSFEQQVAQAENALSVLIGRNPGAILRGKTIDELALPGVPAGLPADLLERRPDLRQAEQSLIAANARIGAAKALYFPSISLTGLFGAASTSLNGLFSGAGGLWNFTGAVTQPIFTGGGIFGQVFTAEAQRKEALASYQGAIQTAFQEVSDALIGSEKTRAQLDAQTQQIEALRNYARLARMRYDGGYSSYLEVLDAERSLFNAELNYTQVQAGAFAQLIGLYKALGGGWLDEADKLAPQPSADLHANPRLAP